MSCNKAITPSSGTSRGDDADADGLVDVVLVLCDVGCMEFSSRVEDDSNDEVDDDVLTKSMDNRRENNA